MNIELKKLLNNADCKMPKSILIIGVVHGDEPLGEYFINEYLKSAQSHIKNNLYFIPRLNFSNERKNKNGVDINRNFKTANWELKTPDDNYFGGFSPNSEPETKFVVNLMDNIKFDCIITIHCPYKVVNYDGTDNPLTLPLAAKISKILDYPLEANIGYPTPGSFGTYAGVERNIPTITIEYDEDKTKEELYPKFKIMFDFLCSEL